MTDTNYLEAAKLADVTVEITDDGIVILPSRISGDIGYYDPQAPDLYKSLSSNDCNVSYYTPEHKVLHEFGAKEYLITFAVGVGGKAAWYVFEKLILARFKKSPKSSVKGEIYIRTKQGDHTITQKYEMAGAVDDALKVMAKINKAYGNVSSAGEKEA